MVPMRVVALLHVILFAPETWPVVGARCAGSAAILDPAPTMRPYVASCTVSISSSLNPYSS